MELEQLEREFDNIIKEMTQKYIQIIFLKIQSYDLKYLEFLETTTRETLLKKFVLKCYKNLSNPLQELKQVEKVNNSKTTVNYK